MKTDWYATTNGTVHTALGYNENGPSAIGMCYEPDSVEPPENNKMWVRLDKRTAKRAVVGGWLYVTEVYGGGVCFVPDPGSLSVVGIEPDNRIDRIIEAIQGGGEYCDTVDAIRAILDIGER